MKSDMEAKTSVGLTEKDADGDGEDDFYTALITEAPYLPGDDGSDVSLDDIEWLDKSLFKHSYDFHIKYYTGIMLATVASLVLGFAVKPLTAVLLRTGKLYDPEGSYQRYLSTVQRVTKFFMLPMDPVEGIKEFQTVRKMHRRASKIQKDDDKKFELRHVAQSISQSYKTEMAEAMRKDLDFVDSSSAPTHILTWKPVVPVSQFDMVLTQLGFFGTMWLYPGVFGIRNKEEEMKGMMHTWAVFGRLLGIKDKYNVCLHADAKAIDKLFRNVMLESLKTTDDTVVAIQHAFMEAVQRRLPFVTYKAFFYYGMSEIEGYKGEHLWGIMTWRDKIAYGFITVLMWLMKSSSVIRILANIVFALFFQLQFLLYMPSNKFLGLRSFVRIIKYSVYN